MANMELDSNSSKTGPPLRPQRTAVTRYGLAAVCLAIALGVRASLTPWIIDYDPFMFFAPAAFIATWFGGWGPGVAALISGVLIGDFFFTPPPYQLGPYTPVQITLIGTYSVATGIGVALIEALHRTRRRAQTLAEQAQHRGERLERAMVERKAAEDALRLREEQLQLVTDSLPVLISYIDREQRYQFLNQQYEVWFNRPRAEIYGLHVRQVWGEEIYAQIREQIESALQGRDVTFERWVENVKGNRWMQTTYVPHRDETGKIAGLFVLVADITEGKEAKEALQQAQAHLSKYAAELELRVAERTVELQGSLENLEKLLYSVAHDLRAPLGAMEGFSRLLLKQYAPQLDALGQDYARRIGGAATRMDRLILDLLAYGRLSHVSLPCSSVQLQATIDSVLDRLREEIRATEAEIQVAQPLAAVRANAPLLEEIIFNLLTNALKFVLPGTTPRVQIRSEQLGTNIRLWLTDNGIGIDPQHHEKIFKIFERLHSNETYPGTGIGLAIVAKGMERMRGRAGVESNLGDGSRFWLELPSAASDL